MADRKFGIETLALHAGQIPDLRHKRGSRVTITGAVRPEQDHAVSVTPAIIGDYIYGICSYGQLRALDARTGERIWESQAATVERARWTSSAASSAGIEVSKWVG